MKTIHLKTTARSIARAANIIKKGGLVAFPTETVYGLGGSAENAGSAKKIYAAKGRPSDNPLIIHVPHAEDAERYAVTSDLYYRLTDAFCPGPLTMIMPKKDTVPYEVTGGLDTVAVRIPSHPVARLFLEKCGVAVAAPSANVSGSPSPTAARHVAKDMDGRIDAIIDGGECEIGLESTIVLLKDGRAVILRPGAVTEEMLSAVVPVSRDPSLLEKPSADFRPQAPGMKYRHYAPSSPLTLLRGPHGDAVEYMKAALESDPSTGVICLSSDKNIIRGKNVVYLPDEPSGQARGLFSALRSFDDRGTPGILSVIPSRTGVGLAVCNRLVKAAGYDIRPVGITIPVIGLTGQSGAGKSTVSKVFAGFGGTVFDCDEIYHSLLYPGSPLSKAVIAEFPESDSGGVPDRKKLSAAVFSDRGRLELLNSITHGAVLDEVRAGIKRAEKAGASFAVVDASQLFEAGYDNECTAVIGVCAPYETRLGRIIARDGISAERAASRLENQHNEDYFRVYCDEIIENGGKDGDLSALTAQVRRIIEKYVGWLK